MALCSSLQKRLGSLPLSAAVRASAGHARRGFISGAVDYLEEPLADRGEGEILLCCSVPRKAQGDQNGERSDVILDL